jgi:hypothetical protein
VNGSAALPFPTKLGADWFKAPVDFAFWARMARRIWQWLKDRRRHRRREHRVTDRELARELGVTRRSIQRGLWALQYLYGAIVRRREHGPGGGRVIEIILPLAGDDQQGKADPRKAKAKAPARPAAGPAPTAEPEPPAMTEDERKQAAAELREQLARDKAEREAERSGRRAPAAAQMGYEEAARRLTEEEYRRLEGLAARGSTTITENQVLEVARRIRSP